MSKARNINHVDIVSALKMQAEAILHKVGLSTAEAIRLFYSQVCLQNGLPFEVKIPNKETRDAMAELESGKGERFKTMKDVWDFVKVMLELELATQFKRDLKKITKQGKSRKLLDSIVEQLQKEEPLDLKHKDHSYWKLGWLS